MTKITGGSGPGRRDGEAFYPRDVHPQPRVPPLDVAVRR